MDARHVDQNELSIGVAAHTENSAASGLRTRTNGSDLLADNAIEQGRFSDVGAASEGDKSSAMMVSVLFVHDDPPPSASTLRAPRPARSASYYRLRRYQAGVCRFESWW